ncbi:HD domain-containing protein [Kineococcus sp. SYSU DK003]|uniref:HD domain-containing protein n=1 Tax=Kineococcus sp. SYSU DK003 TaxID=3383124 RepID=UPI003D7C7A28
MHHPELHRFTPDAPLAQSAHHLAQELLGPDGARWIHSSAVAARAGEAAGTFPVPQRPLLLAAGWLHDIGYSPTVQDAVADSGPARFHPLDGARFLRARGWPAELAALVAHHSGAVHVAAVLGLAGPVRAHVVPAGLHPVADALTWADQTTGPAGQPWTLAQRLTDVLDRHGPDSPNARAHAARLPDLVGAVERTEQRRRSLLRPAARGAGTA